MIIGHLTQGSAMLGAAVARWQSLGGSRSYSLLAVLCAEQIEP